MLVFASDFNFGAGAAGGALVSLYSTFCGGRFSARGMPIGMWYGSLLISLIIQLWKEPLLPGIRRQDQQSSKTGIDLQ
jgi:hypothetical protein